MEALTQKAKELVEKFLIAIDGDEFWTYEAKRCAIVAIESEYHEKRELVLLLKENQTISEKVYLRSIQYLIDEEKQVKQEIEKL